jgi:non-specific serine/threonine protein kinase/serine/threonine-protein kinase
MTTDSDDLPTESLTEDNADATLEATGEVVRAASPSLPRQIDRYRLLKKIGEGGMGEVYEAEQTSPVVRRVALKIMKRGLDTGQVVARFETERQALALMSHGAIARVLDAGETPNGLPFFVMELVKGVSITQFCDTARLSTEERIALFLQVCEGVQHAHQKGVIHRDLKPSNVLVTTQEGDAQVKIIDFGIAKATAQPLTESTLFTELGQLVGTPEYMSPEQAALTASDIDTRSDVYALGVMLYELVSGTLPFDRRTLQGAALSEIQRLIREVDPPRPSTRIGSLADASTSIALSRRTDPPSLVRKLRGDLDWITMKALEKDRTRRYGSASELGADLERHLKNEPVEAGPPSGRYRAKKFVRRHRGLVVTVTVTALLLLAATGVSLDQARRAREAERRAQSEAANADQAAAFLAGLFEQSSPGVVREQELTAREILDKGAERIEDELSGQPQVQARLMSTVGQIYGRLGIYDASNELLEKAVALYQKQQDDRPGGDPLPLIESLDYLALNHGEQGRIEQGLVYSDRVLALIERQLESGKVPPGASAERNPLEDQLTGALLTRGNLLIGNAQYREARATYLRAVDLIERRYGQDDAELDSFFNNIANTYYYEGDYQAAFDYYGRALAIGEKNLGKDHYQVATHLHNMSLILSLLGRNDEALALETRALGIREKVLGPDHWHTALSLAQMAALQLDLGRLDEAESLIRRALEIDQQQFTADKSETAGDLQILGEVLIEQGRFDQARDVLERSLAMHRRLPDEIAVGGGLVALGDYYFRTNDRSRSEALYREALALSPLNDDGWAFVRFSAHAGLARIAKQDQKPEQAKTELESAVAAALLILPADHPEVLELRSDIEGAAQ